MAASNVETVCVACKLPAGITLRVFDKVMKPEQIVGGGTRDVPQFVERPERFVINGNAFAQNVGPKVDITGGYAMTPNVPKELWERWLEHNADSMLVKNKLIFAQPKPSSTEAEATEYAKVRSGLERIDPDNLPNGIQQAPEQKKAA